MSNARLVRKLDRYQGDARLYTVDPPMTYRYWDDADEQGKREAKVSHVVVSATDVMFSGPETYIFPADDDGEVIDWGELDGSFRGGLDHRQALRNAGYEVSS